MEDNYSIENQGQCSFSRRKFINITSAGLCGLMVNGPEARAGAGAEAGGEAVSNDKQGKQEKSIYSNPGCR